jgi:hypothetical protein
MKRKIAGVFVSALIVAASLLAPKSQAPAHGSPGVWVPEPNTSWQWQLSGPVNQSYDAQMYDIDLFDNDASVVASLHAKGRRVVCYLSAGSWENWRSDAKQFPASVLGKPLDGWSDERWLDVRQLDLLAPIMRARLDLCKQKGFDAVEPDNIDGYQNDTGFAISYQEQLRYNQFLATEAHARGLSIGLKNNLDQVRDLLPYYDWAINEECFQYNECNKLMPFVNAGKAVFNVEYALPAGAFCPNANQMNFNAMRKRLQLDAARKSCR